MSATTATTATTTEATETTTSKLFLSIIKKSISEIFMPGIIEKGVPHKIRKKGEEIIVNVSGTLKLFHLSDLVELADRHNLSLSIRRSGGGIKITFSIDED